MLSSLWQSTFWSDVNDGTFVHGYFFRRCVVNAWWCALFDVQWKARHCSFTWYQYEVDVYVSSKKNCKITSTVLHTRMFFDIDLIITSATFHNWKFNMAAKIKSDTVHFKENFDRLFHCCESWQIIYTYRLVLEHYKGGSYTLPDVCFNIYFLSRWYGRNGSTWLLNSECILFLLCGLWSLFQWLLLGYW